jgi:hypothetical protein
VRLFQRWIPRITDSASTLPILFAMKLFSDTGQTVHSRAANLELLTLKQVLEQAELWLSYLTRAPWFVAPDAPKNAHLTMAYVALRYVLPQSTLLPA